jgi:hypothetical protein
MDGGDLPAGLSDRHHRRVHAGGDVDTSAAIVGDIVAASTGNRAGTTGIPPAWVKAREPLPAWATRARSHDVPHRAQP